MPQTLSFNLVHVIFSTKDRAPLIRTEAAVHLHGYLAATARQLGCECYRAGGMPDHVHLALRIPPTLAPAKIISDMKSASSRWMKPHVRGFAWQRGYGLFSVSPDKIGALEHYIDTQAQHHRKRTFEDEMRAFFEKYHVAYDERYVWD